MNSRIKVAVNICLLFLLFFSGSAFAQNKSKIVPYTPATKNSTYRYDPRAFYMLKSAMKKSDSFTDLVAYRAVKENNPALCNSVDNPKDCKEIVDALSIVKMLVENKCNQIKESEADSGNRSICTALNAKDCSKLSGGNKEVCETLLKEDFATFKKSHKSDKFEAIDFTEKLAYYVGLKHNNSKQECEKISANLPLPKKYICDIMFSDKDIDAFFEKLAYDLAFFSIAKQYNNKQMCTFIYDKEIKKSCNNSSVKEFRELRNIW